MGIKLGTFTQKKFARFTLRMSLNAHMAQNILEWSVSEHFNGEIETLRGPKCGVGMWTMVQAHPEVP